MSIGSPDQDSLQITAVEHRRLAGDKMDVDLFLTQIMDEFRKITALSD